jgi:hypothetical protein
MVVELPNGNVRQTHTDRAGQRMRLYWLASCSELPSYRILDRRVISKDGGQTQLEMSPGQAWRQANCSTSERELKEVWDQEMRKTNGPEPNDDVS